MAALTRTMRGATAGVYRKVGGRGFAHVDCMLALIVALSVAQLDPDFPPPPIVHLEDANAQGQELTELRHITASLRVQLDLSRQVNELNLEIVTFDTSAPGWTKGLRVISYLLAAPAFLLGAPVVNGQSPVVAVTTPLGMTSLTPTLNTVGIALAVVVGVAFVVGVGGGIIGHLMKTFELDGLVAQRTSLNEQWAAMRIRGPSFAQR